MKLKRSYSAQLEALPLHEEAVFRKKRIEGKSEDFGIRTKEKMLSRHNSVVERVQNIVFGKLERLEEHN